MYSHSLCRAIIQRTPTHSLVCVADTTSEEVYMSMRALSIMLAPLAPHISAELFARLSAVKRDLANPVPVWAGQAASDFVVGVAVSLRLCSTCGSIVLHVWRMRAVLYVYINGIV
jgi:leucyl-tRNA synthetase